MRFDQAAGASPARPLFYPSPSPFSLLILIFVFILNLAHARLHPQGLVFTSSLGTLSSVVTSSVWSAGSSETDSSNTARAMDDSFDLLQAYKAASLLALVCACWRVLLILLHCWVGAHLHRQIFSPSSPTPHCPSRLPLISFHFSSAVPAAPYVPAGAPSTPFAGGCVLPRGTGGVARARVHVDCAFCIYDVGARIVWHAGA